MEFYRVIGVPIETLQGNLSVAELSMHDDGCDYLIFAVWTFDNLNAFAEALHDAGDLARVGRRGRIRGFATMEIFADLAWIGFKPVL